MDIFGFNYSGIVGDPRPLTPDQIVGLNKWSDLQQAAPSIAQILGQQNYRRYPENVAVERDERLGYCYPASGITP